MTLGLRYATYLIYLDHLQDGADHARRFAAIYLSACVMFVVLSVFEAPWIATLPSIDFSTFGNLISRRSTAIQETAIALSIGVGIAYWLWQRKSAFDEAVGSFRQVQLSGFPYTSIVFVFVLAGATFLARSHPVGGLSIQLTAFVALSAIAARKLGRPPAA